MTSASITLSCPSCGQSLTITTELTLLACGACGQSLQVHREGGIVALVKVMLADDPRRRYEALLRQPMVDGEPGYMLLRIEFQKIGKLHPWTVNIATPEMLETILRSLNRKELDKLIDAFSYNPGGVMQTWLQQLREVRLEISKKENQPF
jgi:uncharacterized protein YbaR (Trm112 family)